MRETAVITTRDGHSTRVEVGAPVVLHESAETLWHLPAPHKVWASGIRGSTARKLPFAEHGEGAADWPSLCGLDGGQVYCFAGSIRRRRCCTICLQRNHGVDHVVLANGPLPPPERVKLPPRRRPVSEQLTLSRLKVLHLVYFNEGVGISRLGELYHEKLGFRSATSCSNAIARGFKEHELPTRTQGEAQRLRAAATRREGYGGRGYKDRRLSVDAVRRLRALYEAGYSARAISQRFYKRFGYDHSEKLRAAIEYAWKQQGLKLRSPREATLLARQRSERRCLGQTTGSNGTRPRACTQAPLTGEEYCLHHHPDHQEAVRARADTLRARKRVYVKVSWALVRPHLEPLLVPRPDRFNRLLETASGALARHTGLDPAVTSRLLKHPPDEVTVERANRLLAPVGLDVAAITHTDLRSAA